MLVSSLPLALKQKLRSHHRKLIELLEINPDIKISLWNNFCLQANYSSIQPRQKEIERPNVFALLNGNPPPGLEKTISKILFFRLATFFLIYHKYDSKGRDTRGWSPNRYHPAKWPSSKRTFFLQLLSEVSWSWKVEGTWFNILVCIDPKIAGYSIQIS